MSTKRLDGMSERMETRMLDARSRLDVCVCVCVSDQIERQIVCQYLMPDHQLQVVCQNLFQQTN